MQRKELLKLAKECRIEIKEEATDDSYIGSTFAMIMEDGNIVKYIQQGCHANVSAEANKGAVYMANLVHTRLPEDITERYINWWVKKSFVSKVFVTKDVKTILEKGIILDCSFPSAYIMIGVIGLRYLWEHKGIVENWDVFKEHVNHDAAILLSHMFVKVEQGGWEKARCYNSGHCWWTNYWNRKEFTNAINHDLGGLESLPSLGEEPKYSPLIHIFSPERKVDWQSKGNLRYPLSFKEIKTTNIFEDKIVKKVYEEENIKKWLQETYSLNYEEKKGKRNAP